MATFRKQRSLIVFVILIIGVIVYSVQYVNFNNHYEKNEIAKLNSEDHRHSHGGALSSDEFSRVQFIHNPNLRFQPLPSSKNGPLVFKNVPGNKYTANHGSSYIKRLQVTDNKNYYIPASGGPQSFSLNVDGHPSKSENTPVGDMENTIYVPPKRIVHFDLKGAPPKVEYLKEVFKLISNAGATGVLLEWEDMFPFTGPLASFRAKNSYSESDVKAILKSISDCNMEVIPLVQTFGHLEFALKTEQWTHLREVENIPQAICPSLNESMSFLQNMIDQVMNLHSGSVKYLHIGCDEVFQLGMCELCRKKVRDMLFLDHTVNVAKYVKTKHLVQPLIWHDMLVHIPASILINIEFDKWVEPVVWVYAEDVYRFASMEMWRKLQAVFPSYWGASAFKGAFGETLNLPPIQRHLDNNLEWLRVMKMENRNFKSSAQGLIITGWQRYDHFAILCELLPSSIPSLIMNLVAVSNGYFDSRLQNQYSDLLACASRSTDIYLGSDPYLLDFVRFCKFPGVEFFKLVGKLENARKQYEDFVVTQLTAKGWLTDYNRNHNFSSSLRTDEIMMDFPMVYSYLTNFIEDVPKSLEHIFDNHTIVEWLEQRVYPMIQKLESVQKSVEIIKQKKVWDVRPLPPLPDFLKHYRRYADRG